MAARGENSLAIDSRRRELSAALERCLDVSSEQIEVQGLLGELEGLEAKSSPPAVRGRVERGRDDGAARGLAVELDGGGEDVRDERRAEAEPRVGVVDGEAAD